MPFDNQAAFGSLLKAGTGGAHLEELYEVDAMQYEKETPITSQEGTFDDVWQHPSVPISQESVIEEPKLVDALDARRASQEDAISFFNPFYASQRFEDKDVAFRLPHVATVENGESEEAVDQVYEEWNHFGAPPSQFMLPQTHHQIMEGVYQDINRRYSLAIPPGSGFELPIPGGHSRANLQFVIEDPSGKENFRDHGLAIENHGRRHSVGAPHLYCCPWTGCNKVFNRFYNLRSHYRIHSGEKPFTCNYCDASFARNHDLKRHERIHLKTKPYVCPVCNKAFSRNDAMNRHVRLNSCSKPVNP